jgi:hypothetical protein
MTKIKTDTSTNSFNIVTVEHILPLKNKFVSDWNSMPGPLELKTTVLYQLS